MVTIESVDRFEPERRKSAKCRDCHGTGRFLEQQCPPCAGSGERPEANKRLLIRFVGKRKGWLAGPVSQAAIAGMYGPQIEQWKGRRIALYVDPSVKFGRVQTGGVRVRPTPPAGIPTVDPLDRPVDAEAAKRIEEAKDDASS